MGSHRPVSAPVVIAWRRLDSPGHDGANLRAVDTGFRIEGDAVFVERGQSTHLRYTVNVNRLWHTESATVQGWSGSTPIHLGVMVDAGGQWHFNGNVVAAVATAIDIDLAFTPATNLLPIRRLDLPVGGSSAVVAAWLRFPELDLQPLDQVYRRSATNAYDYSSHGGAFHAKLIVSPDGFVTHYPNLWVQERV